MLTEGLIFGIFLFLLMFEIFNIKVNKNIYQGLPFLIIVLIFMIYNRYNDGEVLMRMFGK